MEHAEIVAVLERIYKTVDIGFVAVMFLLVLNLLKRYTVVTKKG